LQNEKLEIKSLIFYRRRRSDDAPEVERKLERDARKLLKGKADGEMIIRNQRPHTKAGKHEVIDHLSHLPDMRIKGTLPAT
jgi:hypothetical protein